LADKEEKAYLDKLPISSSLPPEAVDRLPAAAGQIIMGSPDFRRRLQDVGGKREADLPPASREAASRGTE
jgi:NTE family protein